MGNLLLLFDPDPGGRPRPRGAGEGAGAAAGAPALAAAPAAAVSWDEPAGEDTSILRPPLGLEGTEGGDPTPACLVLLVPELEGVGVASAVVSAVVAVVAALFFEFGAVLFLAFAVGFMAAEAFPVLSPAGAVHVLLM